jgi:Recombination enhancement, RecA-dependent nuclease
VTECGFYQCHADAQAGGRLCSKHQTQADHRLQKARAELRRVRATPRRKGTPTPRIKPRRLDDPAWIKRVKALPCCVCDSQPPSEAHHIRDGSVGTGQKAGDQETIPLCPEHHRTGGRNIAFHAGPRTWERLFGTQRELLAETLVLLVGEEA